MKHFLKSNREKLILLKERVRMMVMKKNLKNLRFGNCGDKDKSGNLSLNL